jgi:hypothetical protein
MQKKSGWLRARSAKGCLAVIDINLNLNRRRAPPAQPRRIDLERHARRKI